MDGYNLVANLRLQNIDATEAIQRLQQQLAATVISVPIQLRTQAAIQSLQQIQRQAQATSASLQQTGMANQATAQALNQTASAGNRVTSSFENTARALANSRRFAATYVRDIASLTAGLFSLHKALTLVEAGLSELGKYQKIQVQLAQVENQPSVYAPPMARLNTDVRANAQRYGVSSSTLMEQVTQLRQSNFTAAQTTDMLPLLSKLNLQAQIRDFKGLSDALIVLKSTWGQSTQEIETSISQMLEGAKRYAVENEDLIQGLRKSGAAFKNYGANVAKYVALMTATRQQTRLPATQIATGFNSILARTFSQPQSRAAVESLGVTPYDEQGRQRDVLQVYTELAAALDKLTDAERNELAVEISGVHRSNVFLGMMKAMTTANVVYQDVVRSGNNLTHDAELAQESFANKLMKTREAWNSVIAGMGENAALRATANHLLGMTESLVKLAPLLATIGAARALHFGVDRAAASPVSKFGFPVTSYVAGAERAERIAHVNAMEGRAVPIQNPLVRQGRAMLGNIGANLYANRVPLALGGALLTQYAADQMEPVRAPQVATKSALEATSTGLMVGTMLNPFVGALAGAVVGLHSFSKGLEEAEARANAQHFKGMRDSVALNIQQSGDLFSKQSLSAFNAQFEGIQAKMREANNSYKNVSFARAYGRAVFNPGSTPDDERAAIQRERQSQIVDAAKANAGIVQQYADEILKHVSTLSQFKQYGNGLGEKVLTLGGLGNASFADIIQDKLTRKQAGVPITVTEQQQSEADYRKKMGERAAELQTGFGLIGRTADLQKAASLSSLAIAEQRSAFEGKPANLGDAYNAVILRQAAQLGGSADVNALSERLARLTEVKTQNVGQSGESLTPMIEATANALRALADSASRTRGYFEELNAVTQQLNAKYGIATQFFSTDAQGRQQMVDDKIAATKLIAQGGDLSKLSIDEQMASLRHLQRFADVKGAVAGSQFTGDELRKAAIEKTLGAETFAPEKQQKADLESKILSVMQQANQAQVALANYEAQLQSNFFTNLSRENQNFLGILANIWGVKDAVPKTPAALPPVPTPPVMLAQEGVGQANAAKPQTGADIIKAAQDAMRAGNLGMGVADRLLNPKFIPAEPLPTPLQGNSLPEIPTRPITNAVEQSARARAAWLETQLNKKANPEQFARYADQLGITPDVFTSSNLNHLHGLLQARTKGFTQTEATKLEGMGLAIDPASIRKLEIAGQTLNDHLLQNITKLKEVLKTGKLPEAPHQQLGNHAARAAATARAAQPQRVEDNNNRTAPPPANPAALPDLSKPVDAFGTYVNGFGHHVTTIGRHFEAFGTHVATLEKAFARFAESASHLPTEITMSGSHEISVHVSGGEALAEMVPTVRKLVHEIVGEELDKFRRRLRDNGP